MTSSEYDEMIARVAFEMQCEANGMLLNAFPVFPNLALRCVGGRFEVVGTFDPPRCPRCGPVLLCSEHMPC